MLCIIYKAIYKAVCAARNLQLMSHLQARPQHWWSICIAREFRTVSRRAKQWHLYDLAESSLLRSIGSFSSAVSILVSTQAMCQLFQHR